MRRGLIAWSKDEVPEGVLEARCGRLQAAMRRERLDTVLVHTCFPRPAAVSWLTNFVPYWSEALLVVLPDGPPAMLASLSKRVHGWIREVSHMGEIVAAPHLGRGAAQLLGRTLTGGGRPRIGVVGLGGFARTHAEPIVQAFGAGCLVDATALFASVRQPADAAEAALAARASAIATDALDAAPRGAAVASEIAAAIERSARAAGAEECIVLIAPDLAASPVLRRIEGDADLGARYAVQVSVAYKMAWVRHARSLCRDGAALESWASAEDWFETTLNRMSSSPSPKEPFRTPPGAMSAWTMESCIGPSPLTPVAAKGRRAIHDLPGGSLVVLSVGLDLPDGPWLRAAPATLGG
jgi:hypothetical protein